jgi:tRNA-dihydrouridine synthase
MLRTVRRELSVPLTLKMRSGWDADSINFIGRADGRSGRCRDGDRARRTRAALHRNLDWERAAVKRAVGIPCSAAATSWTSRAHPVG